MEENKVLKKKGTELLLDLFIDMLKKAENGYRKVQDNQSKQSEAEQNTSSGSKPSTDSVRLLEADQNRIAGIIEELSTNLDGMIALSIAADFAQPFGGNRSFINKISELIHTPLDQRKDDDTARREI